MRRTIAALAALSGLASSASATWSIVLIDTRTGEIAVGSATCLTNFDLQAGTPVLIPGIGAATAQSSVDQGGFNRVFIRDRLLEGIAPQDILTLLEGFDNGHQTRQYGIADARGGTATFTGSRAGQWAGGVTGSVGDVVYAVQGNVLAGDPVVSQAEQVIITSLSGGLDLAETMMLAMEEARVYGGDGRCSCSNNDPDGCGSPPDGWDYQTGKSADIAYMLIARAGDGFGCNSIYRVGRGPWGVATGDFNEDGLIDAALGSRNDEAISILLNSDASGHYITFAPYALVPTLGAASGVAAADFDRDGHLDLVYTAPAGDQVGVVKGDGLGGFGFPATTATQDGTLWVVAADLNGDAWPDAAATNLDAGTVSILLNDGTGALAVSEHIPVGISAGTIVAAEIDGAPGIDLACADEDDRTLVVLANDGAGTFSPWRTLDTGAQPLGVAAGDFDGDGRTDLATSNRLQETVSVFRQTTPGVFESVDLGEERNYTAIESADMNGDGLDDLVVVNDNTARLTVMLGRPGQDPEIYGAYRTSSPSNDLALADFNGDGLPDALHNVRQAHGAIAVAGRDPAKGAGYFNDGDGCATASYYMEFNIAFQKKTDPDPVAQLHLLYDAWRADIIGVTDAVRSVALAGADRLPVGAATTIVVQPLDWRQTPIGPGLDVGAAHAERSAKLSDIGATTDNGDGTYTIPVSAAGLPADARGTDLIEIHVRQGDHEIILMPATSITITGPIADWNGDGIVDPTDLDAFLADWNARLGATDLNGDGFIDTRDVVDYLSAWAGQ